MLPRPESQTWVQGDDDLGRARTVRQPGRPHDEAFAEVEHRKVALPGLGPRVVADRSSLERADHGVAERSQVIAEGGEHLAGGGAVAGEPRAYAHRAVRVQRDATVLVGCLEGRLEADAGGDVTAQNVRSRLRGILPDGDGEFQEVHVRRERL